ncbi:MAG: hypothetical protein RR314_06870 [Oscillospiraceae bacterium]
MRAKNIPISLIISLALMLCVLAAAILGIRSADGARSDEAARVLADSVRRAAVQCYAVEGEYPDTLDYLRENYGVYVDDAEFAVFYDIFASNIMPDVTVVKR